MKKIIIFVGFIIFAFSLSAKDPMKKGLKDPAHCKSNTQETIRKKDLNSGKISQKPVPVESVKKETKSAKVQAEIKQASTKSSLKEN